MSTRFRNPSMPTLVSRHRQIVSDRRCRDCGARLNFLGDKTCWLEVERTPKTGELKVYEYHLKCEGEKRRVTKA